MSLLDGDRAWIKKRGARMAIPQFSLNLILGALAAGIILQWLATFFIRKGHDRIHFKGLSFRFDPVVGPLRLLIPALTVALTLPLLRLPERMQGMLEHFIQLWIMASFGWLLTKIVRAGRDAVLSKYDAVSDRFHARRIFTQIRIVEHIINFLIAVLTLALMAMTFAQAKEIGVSFFASAGVVSIIVGLAAQKTLGNLIAGIQIAMAQPIRLEDAVVVEGQWGWIEEITLTYVMVRLWDLRRLILPISYFIEKPFENWTKASADVLGTVFLYVDYTAPVGQIREEFARILAASPFWDKKVSGLQVTEMKEQTVELRALVSAADAGALWDLRCEVREKLLEFLQERYSGSLPRTRMEMASTA